VFKVKILPVRPQILTTAQTTSNSKENRGLDIFVVETFKHFDYHFGGVGGCLIVPDLL
jgi:hypothetical protein